jgi:hypothetical protein
MYWLATIVAGLSACQSSRVKMPEVSIFGPLLPKYASPSVQGHATPWPKLTTPRGAIQASPISSGCWSRLSECGAGHQQRLRSGQHQQVLLPPAQRHCGRASGGVIAYLAAARRIQRRARRSEPCPSAMPASMPFHMAVRLVIADVGKQPVGGFQWFAQHARSYQRPMNFRAARWFPMRRRRNRCRRRHPSVCGRSACQ